MSSSAPDECLQVFNALLLRWPEEPSDILSSTLLDHLCQCRGCLRKWIALEAAADLASLTIIPCDRKGESCRPEPNSAILTAQNAISEGRVRIS